MAEEVAPSFGRNLKDGFRPANNWVDNNIAWLEDIQQFYRERSLIEKEYSAKLVALARKYYEKKSKKASSLSVGDTPALTPGSLESASLTTWTTQLTTLEARASEHDKFAGDLVAQVADPLRVVAGRFEEIRRRHVEYADKLEKERDAVYGELRKTKGKYDTTCQEVENRRKKAESAFDYSKAKAQNAYQQQTLDMYNAKNTYLIGINVANKQKEKYYHETVPELLDSLQDLAETRTDKLNSIWLFAARLEHNTLKANMDHVDHVMVEIPRNLPNLDSMMYVRHNLVQWQEPPDKVFEPSPVWHDDDTMVVDDTAKIFLRNVLSKSKAQLGDLRREVDMKRREVEANQRIKQQIREGKDSRDEVEVVKAVFALKEQLHDIDHRRLTAEVETLTITGVVGDVTFGAKSHNFKSQTFKIPTNCDLCGDRIWGLSAKGFDCRDCGYTCHSKCEMKVPAECPGEQSKEDRKKLKIQRQEIANTLKAPPTTGHMAPPDGVHELSSVSRSNTMNSLSSRYTADAQRSVSGRGTPDEDISTAAGSGSTAAHTMDSSTSLKPMAAPTARKNRVVAPPPSAYISELPGSTVPPSSIPTSSETKGKMLYPYDANDSGEITVPEGREVIIVEPDDGGWTKVRVGYKEGVVPTAYLEVLPTSSLSSATVPLARPSSTYSNSGSSLSSSVAGKKQGPAVAPRRGAKKLRYVEAIYDYTAQSDVEHSMVDGDRYVLIKDDPGDGWAEVEKDGMVKSVPASYVQSV